MPKKVITYNVIGFILTSLIVGPLLYMTGVKDGVQLFIVGIVWGVAVASVCSYLAIYGRNGGGKT